MAQKKKKLQPAPPAPLPAAGKTADEAPPAPGHSVTREVFESLAIAIMLAFFIRTFVAEPFVIPTGSMAPTLMGAHKDAYCPMCGERFKVNASRDHATSEAEYLQLECVAGMCPMCRYTVVFDERMAKRLAVSETATLPTPTYNGDRIVVNKFLYSFTEPKRWDVVVFKFPGHATENYIKRLVGLPGETLMIYQGDLFVGDEGAVATEDFTIAPKPPATVLAMRHPVHDTYREPAYLHERGWPLRWQPEGETSGWQEEIKQAENDLRQRFVSQGTEESWLRYRHLVPTQEAWAALERGESPEPRPKLVDDFQSYNAAVTREHVEYDGPVPLPVPALHQGIHWVGDLMVEADVEVTATEGELLLELVEGGHRFRAVIDIAAGSAHLELLKWQESEPIELATGGSLPLTAGGQHRVLFANVDDQLLLWVDDALVKFDSPTSYDRNKLLGERRQNLPRTSAADPGDLAPVGIGSRGARVAIDRLQIWRDVYYLATKEAQQQFRREGTVQGLHEYPTWPDDDLLYNPAKWSSLAFREQKYFPLGKDQFFVMGDNSPASLDARLWWKENQNVRRPGGHYLERKMLIGRAVGVVWPHTWNYVIPGFTDMRLIR